MDLITVMNYGNDKNTTIMCMIWILQAWKAVSKSKHVDRVVILTEGLTFAIKHFLAKIKRPEITVEVCKRTKLPHVPHKRWEHNVGFKMWQLCRRERPYIFLDADAILEDNVNLDILAKAGKSKPFIAVDHQTIPRHTAHFGFKFINTGFMVVSNPKWMNFDKIWKTKWEWKVPGTDQFLINNYVRNEGYDYHHKDVDYGWNSCGGYKQCVNGKLISAGLPEKHSIQVLHYWDEFKPWRRMCPEYRKKYNSLNIILSKLL